ncbi:MAG TPA: hypothetical protein VFW05_12980 [Verrucomicrobiae bacterium]|nr:hypothetical protein [Verrucomicrobiae bacterium]
MKTFQILALGVSLLFAAGCTTTRSRDFGAMPPVQASERSPEFLVISAVYGSGTKFADVTYRVDDLLRQPGVEFFSRPEWLHADPTPGWNKALVIVYDLNGQRRIFTAGEGERVSLNRLMERPRKANEAKSLRRSKN